MLLFYALTTAGPCAPCSARGSPSIPRTSRVWVSRPACCAWPPSSPRTPPLQPTSALGCCGWPRSSARGPCCPPLTEVPLSDTTRSSAVFTMKFPTLVVVFSAADRSAASSLLPDASRFEPKSILGFLAPLVAEQLTKIETVSLIIHTRC